MRQSLDRNDADDGYSQTIDSIFAAAITQINKTYPRGAVLLEHIAYLAAAPVPGALMMELGRALGDESVYYIAEPLYEELGLISRLQDGADKTPRSQMHEMTSLSLTSVVQSAVFLPTFVAVFSKLFDTGQVATQELRDFMFSIFVHAVKVLLAPYTAAE